MLADTKNDPLIQKQVDEIADLHFNSAGYSKLPIIDAIRGWAIFLVIIAHTGGAFSQLPYPLKKLTNMGWYGVQLFFMASAFTLLLSWNRQTGNWRSNLTKFLIRRFFRIAPMYYFGAALYFLIRPPLEKFNIEQLIMNLLFLNSWSPVHMTTVDESWQVVPGGWSIGVEFSFYFMFPVLACYVISLKRSLIFFTSSLVVSFLAYFYGLQHYKNLYGEQAADNFLFFWLPNQLGIFALAFILYFVINSGNNLLNERFNKYIGHRLVFIFGVLLILIISQIGINKHFSNLMPWLPAHYIISFIFFVLMIGLYQNNFSVFINVLFIRLGEVSFSAYVLHFAVIQLCKSYTHSMIAAEGWMSILYFSLFLPLVIVLTYVFSRLTYKMIELPSIAVGRKVSKNAIFFVKNRGFTNVN